MNGLFNGRILLPTGFGNRSRRMLEPVSQLARQWRAELAVVHVVGPGWHRRRPASHDGRSTGGLDALTLLHRAGSQLGDSLSDHATPGVQSERSAIDALTEWLSPFVKEDLRVRTVLREGDVITGIIDAARSLRPSLVALPAPRSGWKSWQRLGDPDYVPLLLRRLDGPVMLFREPAWDQNAIHLSISPADVELTTAAY
jgi:hypothetical protein